MLLVLLIIAFPFAGIWLASEFISAIRDEFERHF